MPLTIYNTLTRRQETFQTIEPGRVRMYVCGPTVYADAHIGHAMAAIVFDMVRRYLIYQGFDVYYATNFTDVDDKIIRRARDLGQDPLQMAQHYADKYLRHLHDLNVMPADVYPKVSDTMPQIIEFIQNLYNAGFAYTLDGDVYFRVTRDSDYGKLSQRRLDEALSGTRVAEDERKEHPADFALWKSRPEAGAPEGARPDEPAWPSPWGPGRPGWHIECSAMCLHHLGEQIDIHGGGNDLIFPHHENEIAQSESLTGKPFARYWMHNGMLQLSGEKMSKSLGNLITIDQFLKDHTSDALRVLIFSGHYRKPVAFTPASIEGAERALARLLSALRPSKGNKTTGAEAEAVRLAAENARAAFIKAMNNDFNTSSALAAMFELVRAINTGRDAGVNGPFYEAAQATLRELAGVLGITLTGTPSGAIAAPSNGITAGPFIDLLVEVRQDLRAAKQWAFADKIRNQLGELGIALEDTPEGTNWRFVEQ